MPQNNIKQLRTQLSITQRELAAMVGTSQQQIQRIETGKVAAKLGLAQAICSVLNKPLNIVFPDSDNLLKEFRNRRNTSDEDLKIVAANGIEMDGGIWTVKLYLRGQKECLFLPISSADKRRFHAYFQEKTYPDTERFFVFDSDQHRYALNAREVEFHQFLFEPLEPLLVDEGCDEDADCNVCITLTNGGAAIGLRVESDVPEDVTGDIGQLNSFFDMLECEPETAERFVITDEDGEDAFIRVGSIAMVRVTLDALEPVEEDNDLLVSN